MRKRIDDCGQGTGIEFATLNPPSNADTFNEYCPPTDQNLEQAQILDKACQGGVCTVTWKPSRHAA
jgi:hypothetical protein